MGALATLLLAAVSYLGWKVLGLPFAPFDVFDWVVRVLPGPIVTFAIESVVVVSHALRPAGMAAAAKNAEQILAVGFFLLTGAGAGLLLFRVLRVSDEPALPAGLIVGASFGGLTLFVEHDLNRIALGWFIDGAWVFATFLGWGALVGWACDRLRRISAQETAIGSEKVARRRFLIGLSGATLTTTGIGSVWGMLAGGRRDAPGERWSASHALPNAAAAVSPVAGTRPEFTSIESHYRIDTNTRPPAIAASSWRLRISGLVERTLELTLDDIRGAEPMHQFVTLACVSNPVGGDLIGTTRWTGISLQRLLPRLALTRSATHLRIRSADGFFEVLAVETIARDERVMLAYAWDGVPLTIEHGFPMRLYVPDVYGMKQPKWIEAIEAIDHWEPGYWVARGWDREGRMQATSVVDAIEAEGASSNGGRDRSGLVGGIAHAGVRRISKVEVRLDAGQWAVAQLREPLSEATWVVWRADVPLERGDHAVTVRCFEGDGTPQTTAFHTRRRTL